VTDWEKYWDEEDEGYRLDLMSDQEIRGLADGYDDGRIDAVIMAYLRLRNIEKEK